jgi:Protein of unknown function (DUF2628)
LLIAKKPQQKNLFAKKVGIMARLAIYMHACGDSVAYRSGFSWLAALALPVWALRKRLYKTALVALLVQLALNASAPRLGELFDSDITKAIVGLLYLGVYWLIPGWLASRWHRRVLEQTGYFQVAVEPPARKRNDES